MNKTLLAFSTALAVTIYCCVAATTDHGDIKAEVTKRHDEAVKRLQEWIGQVSIAAENRGYPEGAEYMAKLARDAGFQQTTVINTDGKPGVFATLDAGAPKTVGLYFMYDVKQFDPAEWTSPPTEARIVDKPPLGKVIVGRGAVNQKRPEAAFLAALHAIRGAGKKMPVNLVMVAEGEEEIGSPHIPQLVRRPEVLDALKKCVGVFMPATQDLDGVVTVNPIQRTTLDKRSAVGASERTARIAADRKYRRPGRRLHGPRRQNDFAASRGGKDRHAARAGYESSGRAGSVEGTSRQARLW